MDLNINILDILFAIILIYSAFVGAKEGFVRTLSGLVKYVVAFISAKMFSGALAGFLTVNSGIYKKINNSITTAVSSVSVEEATVELWLEKLNMNSLPAGLREYIADLIEKSRNSLQGFAEHFAEKLSAVIFEAICFIIVFILALIIWKLITLIIDKIAGLPVLRQVNGLGGFAVGLIKGLLICVIASTLCYTISMMDMPLLTEMLNNSYLAKYFYIGFILNL